MWIKIRQIKPFLSSEEYIVEFGTFQEFEKLGSCMF